MARYGGPRQQPAVFKAEHTSYDYIMVFGILWLDTEFVW